VLANKPKSATVVPVMKMLSHWYNKTNWTSLNDKFIIENFVFLVYLQITMDDVWCPIEWRKYQRPFRIWRQQSTFTLILLKRLEDQFYQTVEKWWNEKKTSLLIFLVIFCNSRQLRVPDVMSSVTTTMYYAFRQRHF
jgi:hypothetical protein